MDQRAVGRVAGKAGWGDNGGLGSAGKIISPRVSESLACAVEGPPDRMRNMTLAPIARATAVHMQTKTGSRIFEIGPPVFFGGVVDCCDIGLPHWQQTPAHAHRRGAGPVRVPRPGSGARTEHPGEPEIPCRVS